MGPQAGLCAWFERYRREANVSWKQGWRNPHIEIEEADICQSLKEAGKHLGHVHLVDSNRCVPGYGHIPFDRVVQILREIDYNGKLSFECLAKPSAEKAANDALNHLRGLLSGN